MNLEAILDRFQGVRRSGTGWTAQCPAHKDRNPSLSIDERDGKILVHCHAGCSTEDVLKAAGIEVRELFADSTTKSRTAGEYDYVDEKGHLLFQVVRYEPKGFRQRRSNGNGGWTWNLDGVRRVLYQLPEVLAANDVLICEGEKDCLTAKKMGFVATTNAGGAGKWREEYSESLRGKNVTIIPDTDEPGRKHAEQVAQSLHGKAGSVKVFELPQKDLSEWAGKGGTRDSLLALIRNASKWKPQASPVTHPGNPVDPWSLAANMNVFLQDEEEAAEFLFAPAIAKEAITEIFAPRGLGKSLWALFVAVHLAKVGRKVLLIDRDNPRRVVRDRLRSFGATCDLFTLKVLSRENAPPLTNVRAWAEFPYSEYDLVILDSLDSAAEGVGEQDSTKPSLAIAPLLNIVRRENGPAVLLLGNTIKSGAHSRGSGIIEDRADIVFEVRDATSFHPTGKKPWIEELPATDAGSWAGRSTRRKQLTKYRLAFIATKFRIGEEPEPFIVEIDLTAEPWAVRDITDDVDREGAAVRARTAEDLTATIEAATESLRVEILRCEAAGQPVLLKKHAEDFLTSSPRRLSRKVARQVIDSTAFEIVKVSGKGHPKGIRLAGKNNTDGGNSTLTEAPLDAGFSNDNFRRPHPAHTAEIPSHEICYPCGSQNTAISAKPIVLTRPEGMETAPPQPGVEVGEI
jgi:5S rRNA maturation endonuclease (ribonuclease M5)